MLGDDIALVDLDGSVAGHDEQLYVDLEKLRSPNEPKTFSWKKGEEPDYIFARMNLIRASREWWENLPVIDRGMQLVDLLRKLEFRIIILTQGPRVNPAAWEGKVRWVNKNMPFCNDITITRDKGIVYGKVLVDDFPKYIEKWVEHRPRGLVIMPAYDYNEDFTHSNLIRYNGIEQLGEIEAALHKVKDRKPSEKLERE